MKCLYCDSEINTYTLYDLFFEQDKLCEKCRKKMSYHHQKFNLDGLEVESFYDYDSMFKDLLLQYKECYDEILSEIFLFRIENILKIKYFDYKILYIPSSKKKLNERGFNHLRLIFQRLNFEEIKGLTMIEELSQENKNYLGRFRMIDNYFYSGKAYDKVLIVDDVCTSGSSLRGAYKTLKQKNCRQIRAVVLAKTC